MRNVPSPRVRTQHQTAYARAVTKLCSVRPLFHFWGIDMIPPAAPVIPGYEDHCLRPETSLHDGVHLVDRPLHAAGDVFNRMLAEPGGRIDPRNRRQLPSSGIL